jgi:hypothetical protein
LIVEEAGPVLIEKTKTMSVYSGNFPVVKRITINTIKGTKIYYSGKTLHNFKPPNRHPFNVIFLQIAYFKIIDPNGKTVVEKRRIDNTGLESFSGNYTTKMNGQYRAEIWGGQENNVFKKVNVPATVTYQEIQ